MILSKTIMFKPVLLLSLIGGCYLDMYLPGVPLSEATIVLIALTIALLLPGRRLRAADWGGVLLLPLAAILLIMALYALIFAERHDTEILPSILANRFFLLFLIGPMMFLMHAAGAGTADMKRVLVAAMVAVTLLYLLAYWHFDPEALLRTSGELGNLVQYDPVRGYRLKGPDVVFIFVLLYFLRLLPARQSPGRFLLRAGMVVLAGSLLLVTLPRIYLASLVLAYVGYFLFFASRARFRVFLLLLPLLLVGLVASGLLLGQEMLEALGHDGSFQVRMQSARLAWQVIVENPLFGMGQASYHSISYRDLLGSSFYPYDIGLLGIWLRFGLVGLVAYVGFVAWLLVGLVRLRDEGGRQDPALWALLLTIIGMTVASLTTPIFIAGEGIPIAAFAMGLLFIRRRRNRALAAARHGRGTGFRAPAAGFVAAGLAASRRPPGGRP